MSRKTKVRFCDPDALRGDKVDLHSECSGTCHCMHWQSVDELEASKQSTLKYEKKLRHAEYIHEWNRSRPRKGGGQEKEIDQMIQIEMTDSARPIGAELPAITEHLRNWDSKVNSLGIVEPQSVRSTQINGDEWEEIEMAVDSGASETVAPEDCLSSLALQEGEAKRKGVQYEVADGILIPNLGEKAFVAVGEEGSLRRMKVQVCDVNKALLSVRRVTQAGNRVVFEENSGYIEDVQTGEKMWLKEKDGMYILKLWVRKDGKAPSGFTRQGR